MDIGEASCNDFYNFMMKLIEQCPQFDFFSNLRIPFPSVLGSEALKFVSKSSPL